MKLQIHICIKKISILFLFLFSLFGFSFPNLGALVKKNGISSDSGNILKQMELIKYFKKEHDDNLYHAKLNNIFLVVFFSITTIGFVVAFVLPLLPEGFIPNRKWISVPAAVSAGATWLIQKVKFKGRRDNHYAKSDAANAFMDRAKFQLSNPPTDKEIHDLSSEWNAHVARLGGEMKKVTDMGF